jgi:hypothetical protein
MTSVPDFEDLEARMVIIALEGHYTKTWDTGDAEAWASLSTEDGVIEMISVGELPHARFHGRDALTKFCSDIHQEYSSILHLPSIPSLSIGESRIQGWINFEARMRRGSAVYECGGRLSGTLSSHSRWLANSESC